MKKKKVINDYQHLRAWITKADGTREYSEGDQKHIDAQVKFFGGTSVEYVDKRPEFKRPVYERPVQPDYAVARQEAYPSISDQLDMFWKYVADPDHPEVKAMAAKIAAIKASIPKT